MSERITLCDRLATDAYANHEIRGTYADPGRWLLQSKTADGKWSSGYWTEIICLHGRQLFVGGDVDPVVFAYGPDDHESRVRWMGSRKSGADVYLVEKASIGTGREAVITYCPDKAIEDIRALIADEAEAGASEESCGMPLDNSARDRRIELLTEAIGRVGCREELYESLLDDPELHDVVMETGIGEIPGMRVFHAWAALRRLCQLLDANATQDP